MSLGRMEAKTPIVKESLFTIHQNSNEPVLNETVRAQIGRRLRSLFESLGSEPLPSRMQDLLVQIDRSLRERSK